MAKAAFGGQRNANCHYDTMAVDKQLVDASSLVLVDDVVTTGSTLFGAARRLWEAYPDKQILAFSAVRTISKPQDFLRLLEPVVGEIGLRKNGSCWQRP